MTRKYKISFECRTEKERILIEGYIRYALKMIRIERLKVEEKK